jgi:starch phosphorylase
MMSFLNETEHTPQIAYFSMEIGLDSKIPTYSGGLGVLAGDTLRAAADLRVPMVGVTLLYRKGYFMQRLDSLGNQREIPIQWSPDQFLTPLPQLACIEIEGRKVQIRAWRYLIQGISGYEIPVYLLDTSLPENQPEDRTLTDNLYGGDERYRLCQEAVLGLGGIAMLRALGLHDIHTYHMNEGHSALLTLALLEEETGGEGLLSASEEDMESVRYQCVFTTHTPVAAGHDQFSIELASRVLGEKRAEAIMTSGGCLDDSLNMTHLALFFSRFVNGVAMRHGQVSRGMFPEYPIDSITNGIHAGSWVSPPFEDLFNRFIPEWAHQNFNLRYAVGIPLPEIREAHLKASKEFLDEVALRTNIRLNPNTFTIGFARRATPYKRATMLFSDIERLKRIVKECGPIQIVYCGKAHPRDMGGKDLIRQIFRASASLRDIIPIVYIEEYDMAVAKKMCAGVDLWLNTPERPLEASGTSGMKAALNGVPSLSVLDGWWIEGHYEGVTGWSIGNGPYGKESLAQEVGSLYDKLEFTILPLYYQRPAEFDRVMRSAIALNGSFFNTQRMVLQYMDNAYSQQRSRKKVVSNRSR